MPFVTLRDSLRTAKPCRSVRIVNISRVGLRACLMRPSPHLPCPLRPKYTLPIITRMWKNGTVDVTVAAMRDERAEREVPVPRLCLAVKVASLEAACLETERA